MLRFISATRQTEAGFSHNALLGISLHKLSSRCRFETDIAYENTRGLPLIYNEALDASEDTDTLLFVHDDVRIDDWFLPERLGDAFRVYDVVGVAGNRQRAKGQTAWHWDTKDWDWQGMSGCVSHIHGRGEELFPFGDCPARVKVLDGLFLAVRANQLREHRITFDPQFPFHLYDLDFSRQCEKADLRLGTWPIAVTHASHSDGYETPGWHEASRKYLAKWPD